MERFVKLDRLPEGLMFPPQFTDRIRYDDQAGHLCFLGFMSKADFDKLYLLSDDWTYRRSLEELFRRCTLAEEKPSRVLGHLKAVLNGIGLV
jgi:hypothetical protein